MAEPARITITYAAPEAAGPEVGGAPPDGTPRRGPLTLGQDNMIRCILGESDQTDLNKQSFWPIPPGTDLPAALAALRTLAERHESLRTVFPDRSGAMPEYQEVRESGEFAVGVVEADQGLDLDLMAADIARRNRVARFDLSDEFPLRITLITLDGRPVRLVAVVCHAAVDATATGILFQEWYELASGSTLPPPTGRTPRDVAHDEQSPVGMRRARASLRHWNRILREEPQAVFADARIGRSDRLLPTLVLRSESAAHHLEQAARRAGTSGSNVMLAAFSALIAHSAGNRRVVMAALASNRHRPGSGDYVGTLAQDALLCVDAQAADFDELIRNAASASIAGYWHSTFDSAKLWQLIEDAAFERGARFARQVVLNDMSASIPAAAVAGRPGPPEDPELNWLPPEVVPTRLMLNIWRLTGCVELSLHCHPHLFDRAGTERFVLGMLRLIEAAAHGAVPLDRIEELTGIGTARRPDGWLLIDNSWIDPAAVRELLAEALDKRPVHLAVQDGRMTAHIAEDGRAITPDQAHRAVMAALPGRETAMAPQYYVVHAEPTRTARDGHSDRPPESPHGAVLAEGDGRGAVGA